MKHLVQLRKQRDYCQGILLSKVDRDHHHCDVLNTLKLVFQRQEPAADLGARNQVQAQRHRNLGGACLIRVEEDQLP